MNFSAKSVCLASSAMADSAGLTASVIQQRSQSQTQEPTPSSSSSQCCKKARPMAQPPCAGAHQEQAQHVRLTPEHPAKSAQDICNDSSRSGRAKPVLLLWNSGQSRQHSVFSQEASLHAAVALFTQVWVHWIKGSSKPANLVFPEYVPRLQPVAAEEFPEPEAMSFY